MLKRGITFIFKPTTSGREALHRDLYLYHRRIKLIDYYKNWKFHHIPFTEPCTREPERPTLSKLVRELIHRDVVSFHFYWSDLKQEDSLSINKCLKELKQNPNIVIKKADINENIIENQSSNT